MYIGPNDSVGRKMSEIVTLHVGGKEEATYDVKLFCSQSYIRICNYSN